MKPHYVSICGPKPRRTPNKNLLFDLHSRLLTQSKLFFLISNYLYLLCLHCYSCHTACCRTGTVIKHRHEPGSASLVVQMVNGLVLMHHFSTVLEHLKRFIQHVSSPFSTPNTHTTDCWWWFTATPGPQLLQQQEETPTQRPCTWRSLLVILLINIESQGVHAQTQLCSLLILDVEVVDSVHFKVLGDLQVLQHSILPARTGKDQDMKTTIPFSNAGLHKNNS